MNIGRCLMMLGNVGLAGLDHVPMQWVFICILFI